MACRCGDIPNAEHDREVLLDMLGPMSRFSTS